MRTSITLCKNAKTATKVVNGVTTVEPVFVENTLIPTLGGNDTRLGMNFAYPVHSDNVRGFQSHVVSVPFQRGGKSNRASRYFRFPLRARCQSTWTDEMIDEHLAGVNKRKYRYQVRILDVDKLISWDGVDQPLRCLKVCEQREERINEEWVRDEPYVSDSKGIL